MGDRRRTKKKGVERRKSSRNKIGVLEYSRVGRER